MHFSGKIGGRNVSTARFSPSLLHRNKK